LKLGFFFILLTFVFLPITFLMAWSTRKDQLPYLIRIDEIEIYAEIGRGAGSRTLDDIKEIMETSMI